jgi:hypothetical protein
MKLPIFWKKKSNNRLSSVCRWRIDHLQRTTNEHSQHLEWVQRYQSQIEVHHGETIRPYYQFLRSDHIKSQWYSWLQYILQTYSHWHYHTWGLMSPQRTKKEQQSDTYITSINRPVLNKGKKYITFTYHGPAVWMNTKLFRITELKIAYKTKNTLRSQLQKKWWQPININ